MRYEEAQQQLREILKSQKTITTKRLAELLQAMNVSLKKDQRNQEVEYLKNEIRKLKKGAE
ncbi:hypothetical protein HWB91_gp56 [Bacillus phage vB_BboS-125]|uniref:Uncharacterized protein n=1 Tax=Bacillus phage vB_BboS-125 TaxID=2419618 RepID=A0A3G3BWE3_9CAUD|nr:hypothetical protein HWB91_gp56 [Bacillus phage vB_BboS-125]AYP68426.1 hypothetical protein BboS125_00057 [Bacillus phage vB_BboS-125]